MNLPDESRDQIGKSQEIPHRYQSYHEIFSTTDYIHTTLYSLDVDIRKKECIYFLYVHNTKMCYKQAIIK